MQIDLIVTSREEIEDGIIVYDPYVVISIYDSDSVPARLIRGSGFIDAIFLEFDDTDPEHSFGKKPMSLEQARQIWEFIKSNHDKIGAIVCHCLAGMSRSPAVALAIAEGLDEDTSYWKQNFSFNEHVYQTMRQAREDEDSL